MRTKVLIVVLVFALSLILAGAVLADNGLEWPRWVVSGGASDSAAGGVTLHATLGQPFVGLVSDGDITLGQGFWYGSSLFIYLPLVQK